MTNITIILTYFGKWPQWMPFFLQTCKHNPSIDFLFFCDAPDPIMGIENIRLVTMDMDGFNSLASRKLGMDIRITAPYKICDLRPAFGRIFEDYLTEATFWGNSDVDLVFGDIRQFITEDVLAAYDVITARKEYLVGHFTLYRNQRHINELYTRSPQYKFIFTTVLPCSFDECVYLWKELIAGRSILDVKASVESMTHVVVRQQNAGLIRVFFSHLVLEQDRYDSQGKLEDFKDTVCWNDGKVISQNENREYMYFHFHFLKKKPEFSFFPGVQPGNRFYIQPAGFTFAVDS
jgi:hypothetical protein